MEEKKTSTSRRAFLKRSAAVAPLAVAGPVGLFQLAGCEDRKTISGETQDNSRNQERPYTPTYFNAEEWRFIEAATARLIPADEFGPSALEAGVPEFIDRQMDTRYGRGELMYMHPPFDENAPVEFGWQTRYTPRDLYRAAIPAVNAYCSQTYTGKVFADLSDGDKDAVLKALEKGTLTSNDVPLDRFFAVLLQNTKEGYFSDPIHGGNKNMGAWKMIGFPGARADFTDWVGQHGAVYPLPPVDIAGKRG